MSLGFEIVEAERLRTAEKEAIFASYHDWRKKPNTLP